MTKLEFTNRIGKDIQNNEWEEISIVYAFHPAIHDVGGKDEIASIYKIGGMQIIKDMLPRAQRIADLEIVVQKCKMELEKAQQILHEAMHNI